jgi:hypothetical protein
VHPFAKSHGVDSPKGSRPGTRPDDSLPPAHRSGRARDYVNAAKRRVTSDSGNNSIDERLVDETLDAYVDWREECAGVRDAYRRWSTAPLSHVTDAFREYRTALDNEQHAANHYAQLIRRLTQHASARPQNQRDERHWRPARSWWRRRGGVTRDA